MVKLTQVAVLGLQPVRDALWHPHGNEILLTGLPTGMWLRDENYQFLRAFNGSITDARSTAWSPQGNLLLCADEAILPDSVADTKSLTIRIWEVATGNPIATLYNAKEVFVTSVDWSRNGEQIAASLSDNSIRIWDANTRQLLHILQGHTKYAASIKWSSDSKHLMSSGYDRTIRIWDTLAGTLVNTFESDNVYHDAIIWHPNGVDLLYPDATTGNVYINNAFSNTKRIALRHQTARLKHARWSPKGDLVVGVQDDGQAWIWKLKNGGQFLSLNKGDDFAETAEWHPQNQIVAVSYQNRVIKIWDANTKTELYTFVSPQNTVRKLAWSPNGKKLIGISDHRILQIWGTTSEPFPLIDLVEELGADEGLYSIALSNDQQHIAHATERGNIWVWSLTDEKPVAIKTNHKRPVDAMLWSTDDSELITGDQAGLLEITPLTTQEQLKSIHVDGMINQIVLLPASDNLAITTILPSTAQILNSSTLLRQLKSTGTSSWSLDGSVFASVSEYFDSTKVTIADLNGSEREFVLPVTLEFVTAVAWSNDHNSLAIGCESGEIHLIDISSGQLRFSLKQHLGAINSLAWQPNDNTLASASNDHTMRIWNTTTGICVETLYHTSIVISVVWSNDGKRLVSGGLDNLIQVWEVS